MNVFMLREILYRETYESLSVYTENPGICDFILEENSNRWRAKEGFITTGEMKESWSAFISTRPQTLLATVKAAAAAKGGQQQLKGPFNAQG